MISETDVEKAVDYLRDAAHKAAAARAERAYLEEYRKTIRSQIMREHADLPIAAQEREALADPKYVQHLAVMREAIERDEYHRWMMAAAEAKISAWQTQTRIHRTQEQIR